VKKLFVCLIFLLGLSFNESYAQKINDDVYCKMLSLNGEVTIGATDKILKQKLAYQLKAKTIKLKIESVLNKMRVYTDFINGYEVEKIPSNDLVKEYKILKTEYHFVQEILAHINQQLVLIQKQNVEEQKLYVSGTHRKTGMK